MSSSALPQPVPAISAKEFDQIRSLAQSSFGLDLRQGKEQLVSSRLWKHIRAGGFDTFEQYFSHVQHDKTGESLICLIDALTTNHTSFLREADHFRFLIETVLPEFSGCPRFSVWSAASSTGEEPYSILFSLLEAPPAVRPMNLRVLASDISTRVLALGREGAYSLDRLRTLPPGWLNRYFEKRDRVGSSMYQVRPEYRSRVEFRRVNLNQSFPSGERHHVVFCRNVMIYFSRQTQEAVINRLFHCVEPGGYLFVGHAESLTGLKQPFQYIRPAVYRKGK